MTSLFTNQALLDALTQRFASLDWDTDVDPIRGRPDLVVRSKDGAILILELKMTPGKRLRFNDVAQIAEWSQAMAETGGAGDVKGVIVTSGEVVPSVSQYARDAGISIVRTTDRLDETVDRVVRSVSARAIAEPPPDTSTARGHQAAAHRDLPTSVRADDLVSWADRTTSRVEFPRLVRRLIADTNDQIVQLDMRAGEGTDVPGFDGLVEAVKGTPLVPTGLSVWELGTGTDVRRKANEDYEKRTASPGTVDKRSTTFVFATPRRWAQKQAWAAERRQEAEWLDVRAYDADDLETALESAPAVRIWLNELLGIGQPGVQTIESWWEDFSHLSLPTLSASLVLAGRADQASQLLDTLDRDARTTTVAAGSANDVLAFVAAAIFSAAADAKDRLLPRTLVVPGAAGLDRLAGAADLVLLMSEELASHQARFSARNHVVYLAGPGYPADISVPPISLSEAFNVLTELGVGEDRARQLAGAARRGLRAYQRLSPSSRALPSPAWVEALGTSRIVRRAYLVGSWSLTRSGDLDVLAAMFNQTYDDAEGELRDAASGDDPLFAILGQSWAVLSPENAWDFAMQYVSESDLDVFETAVQTVLGAVDPRLDLPSQDRWVASLEGIARIHSSDLRKGLATTLALNGSYGELARIAGGQTLRDWANTVCSRLLRRAVEDDSAQLWESLWDVLPLLAEASPQAVLGAIQEASDGPDPQLARMFQDRETTNSPHIALLWTLETLAWSEEHAPLAIQCLARLAEMDPGGRLSNRPLGSLTDIFRPWLPQTSLDSDRRMVVLDAVRRNHPTVAWKLLLALLPTMHSAASHTAEPRYRPWPVDRGGVSRVEYWQVSTAVAERVLEDVGSESSRWVELIDRLSDLPPPTRETAYGALEDFVSDESDSSVRREVWEVLEDAIRKHRSFPDAEWSLPTDDLDRLGSISEQIRPEDPAVREEYLFDALIADRMDESWEVANENSRRSRARAAAEIEASGGLAALLAMASRVNFPWLVGQAIADADLEGIERELIALLGSDAQHSLDLARGYAAAMVRQRGLQWVDSQLDQASGSPLMQARLLLAADPTPVIWQRALALGAETDVAYWTEFRVDGLGDFRHIEAATRELLRHSRPAAAVDLLSLYLRGASSPLPTELVLNALEAFVQEQQADANAGLPARYELEQLLEFLRMAEADEDRLGLLEWRLLPALSFDARSPILERRLSREPSFFVEILSLCYRREGQQESDVPQDIASNAWKLLSEWRIVPGSNERGAEVDPARLSSWLNEARTLLATAGLPDVGDVYIGQVFAHSRPDEDGTWPTRPVRDQIEALANSKVDEGFMVQAYNNRGGTTRGVYDGGDQERVIAERYERQSGLIRDEWPRTAALLRRLSEGYLREAGRMDEEAERRMEGFD